jgi:hypothetical protein
VAGIATVVGIERAEREDGAKVTDVQVDPGGSANVSAEHFAAAGDDAPPLPGDSAITVPSSGRGKEAAVGYVDPKIDAKAQPGEKRIYARDGDGVLIGEIWLKGDGTIVITNREGGAIEMAPGGNVTINGVLIDTSGNVVAPGEITAKDGPTSVKLTTHNHPDAMGGTGPATPGS